MKLTQLLKDTEYLTIKGNTDIDIKDIIYDSRSGKNDGIFVCLKGFVVDGHDFARQMYDSGVRAFVAEHELELPDDATVVIVKNARIAIAQMSAVFFGYPAKRLTTIALTGTKGKTSTSFMIKSILEKSGRKVGVIGTTGIYYNNTHIETENSTPEAYDIHRYFKEMADSGCCAVVMEATSQGFKMHRTDGINFDIGIFTNLSRDHIGPNEHSDFDEYVSCKQKLFKQSKFAIMNIDSKYWKKMLEDCDCPYITFGMSDGADYIGDSPRFVRDSGQFFTTFYCKHALEMHKIEVSIPGRFSVYNALAAIACARKLGTSYEDIRSGLRTTVVKGRMEVLPDTNNITVVIDYAHNEISMKSLYDTLSLYEHGKVFTVFGAGGNRSRLRRFSMGEISGKNSDLSVITSDNPRFEKVEDIIADIVKGIEPTGGEYVIIPDRKKAIHEALSRATEDDIVLIVGKGQQEYEEIQGVKHPFNERQIVAEYFAAKA